MTLATDIENALARYLTAESSSASGGISLLKTQSGAGSQLSIRTGHDDAGTLPDAGFIVCACEDGDIQQPIIGANYFQAPAFVRLVYPSDNYASDADTLASFQQCELELERLLVRDDIAEELTNQGEGVLVHGPYEGQGFTTAINGRQRVAEWKLPLNVSCVGKLV